MGVAAEVRGQVSALYSTDQLYLTREAQELWEVRSHQMRACYSCIVPIGGLAINSLANELWLSCWMMRRFKRD